MASFITAGNATNGLQVSSDNTGILELKTGTGSGTTAVTVNASQNVGVGTSSPSSYGSSRLAVVGGELGVSNTSDARLYLYNGTTASALLYADSTRTQLESLQSKPLTFWTGSTERARIAADGVFMNGTTNPIVWNSTNTGVVLGNAAAPAIQVSRNADVCLLLNRNNSNGTIAIFARQGTQVGSIDVTTTATSYVTSSDYRLKENVQPMTGALAKVAALKPCTYTWKVDGSEGQGFIAHELAEVVPDAVTGDKDAVDEDGTIKPQGVDTSFLVATLTAAIQEQQAMIDEMKAEIAALKGAA